MLLLELVARYRGSCRRTVEVVSIFPEVRSNAGLWSSVYATVEKEENCLYPGELRECLHAEVREGRQKGT